MPTDSHTGGRLKEKIVMVCFKRAVAKDSCRVKTVAACTGDICHCEIAFPSAREKAFNVFIPMSAVYDNQPTVFNGERKYESEGYSYISFSLPSTEVSEIRKFGHDMQSRGVGYSNVKCLASMCICSECGPETYTPSSLYCSEMVVLALQRSRSLQPFLQGVKPAHTTPASLYRFLDSIKKYRINLSPVSKLKSLQVDLDLMAPTSESHMAGYLAPLSETRSNPLGTETQTKSEKTGFQVHPSRLELLPLLRL